MVLLPGPTLDGIVACPTCKGTGKAPKEKQEIACFDCLGKAWIPRKEAITQIIVSHGDDLQYGGPYCKQAFKAVVDAYVLLRLWGHPEMDMYILGDKNYPIPGLKSRKKDILIARMDVSDLKKALDLLK